eukprot:1192987-Prorocentrum_minimum.AAC.2
MPCQRTNWLTSMWVMSAARATAMDAGARYTVLPPPTWVTKHCVAGAKDASSGTAVVTAALRRTTCQSPVGNRKSEIGNSAISKRNRPSAFSNEQLATRNRQFSNE